MMFGREGIEKHLCVRWSPGLRGYIDLIWENRVTSIKSKGCEKWLFDRLRD